MSIIKNKSTLKKMNNLGLIKYPVDPRFCYVNYNEKEDYSFTYKNNKYRLQYFDGCFYPYVVLKN